MEPALIRRYLGQTETLRAPRRALSTFGATTIPYHLISPIEEMGNHTRLREGTVLSQKPLILTADALQQRFEGFGDDAREFMDWISREYRDVLRSLEYQFKNEGLAARVISDAPRAVAERITADLDARDEKSAAVIRCPDGAWSLALMKLTLDESARSFPQNVRDLERRGMFDPEGRRDAGRRREIEGLFAAAAADPAARAALGEKLKDYGLFAEYEDRYLSLF